jgi:hypothetical protein
MLLRCVYFVATTGNILMHVHAPILGARVCDRLAGQKYSAKVSVVYTDNAMTVY